MGEFLRGTDFEEVLFGSLTLVRVFDKKLELQSFKEIFTDKVKKDSFGNDINLSGVALVFDNKLNSYFSASINLPSVPENLFDIQRLEEYYSNVKLPGYKFKSLTVLNAIFKEEWLTRAQIQYEFED
nr:MAG: hypothetical protein [Ips virga-like virus 1]